MASSVTFVALPAGVDADGGLRLSVLVVPRLDGADSLGATPFADWPAVLAGVRFGLTVNGVRSALADRTADSELWRVLFPAGLPVRSGDPEELTPLFVTYPADRLATLARTVRAEEVAGRSGGMERLRLSLGGRGADAATIVRADGPGVRAAAEARLASDRSGGRPAFRRLRDGPEDDLGVLADLALFHEREPEPDGAATMSAAEPPVLDFHQRASMLADHPALLRRAGIVLDWVLAAGDVGEGTGEIAVVAEMPNGAGLEAVAPLTAVRRTATRFVAAARSGPDSLLALGASDGQNPCFALTNLDVDAAGQQLLHSVATGEPPGPPRTIGVSLLQRGRAQSLHETELSGADALVAGAPLRAEDLTRGIRIDVREEGAGAWASLHARTVRYTVGAEAFTAADEGCLVAAMAQRTGAGNGSAHDPNAAAFLSEQVMLWNGWSLTAPRPGQATGAARDPASEVVPHEVVAAAGSLPRLRFGRSYRFRARRVDLVGNGLPSGELDTAAETPDAVLPPRGDRAWRFLRHEPIGPPEPPGVAEGVVADRIVIGDGISAEDSVMALGPPGVAPLLAEWSGVLDAAFGPAGNPAALHALATRERLPDPHAAGIAVIGCPGLTAGEIADFATGELRRRAGPIGTSPGVLLIPLAGTWPDVVGIILALAAGEAPPAWDAAARRLTLAVPAGAAIPVSLRTVPTADAVALLDDTADDAELAALAPVGLLPAVTPGRTLTLLHAVRQPAEPTLAALPAPVRAANSPAAWIGADIAFDPATTMGLRLEAEWEETFDLLPEGAPAPMTRAVLADVPLGADAPLPARVTRPEPGLLRLGQPDFARAQSGLDAAVSALSAAVHQVDTVASQEGFPRNSLDMEFRRVAGAARGLPADTGWPLVVPAAGSLADLADMLATPEPDVPDDIGLGAMPLRLSGAYRDVASAARRVAGQATAALALLQSGGMVHSFGDGRARHLAVRAVATSRFAADYPAGSDTERSGPMVRVVLPASARPQPPQVIDMVPTFTWSRSRSSDGANVSKRTTGLRLVLKRPWLSSGPGEMLAVMFGTGATDTHWARDPLIDAAPLPQIAGPEHARGGTRILADRVSAVAYPVRLDREGRAIADVMLDVGAAYAPWVQLGVARFQPDAIKGMELSERVLLEAIPLPPDRTLEMVGGGGSMRLVLSGPANGGTAAALDPLGRARNRVRARVQRLMDGATGDAAWIDAPGVGTVIDDPAGEALWQGVVQLFSAGPTPLRVLVEEFELWAADDLAESERLIFAEGIDIG